MRLGISTACFYPLPLEEAVDRIAALEPDKSRAVNSEYNVQILQTYVMQRLVVRSLQK